MLQYGVTFSIELDREDDGRWLAEVPGLAGVMCYGANRDDASREFKRLPSESSPNASNTEKPPPNS